MFAANSDFIALIDKYVSTWTRKYIFFTKQINRSDDELQFVTEFSLPTQSKTVSISTVKVYFYAKKTPKNDKYSLHFQFETDELMHNLDSTVRYSMMEPWIEKYLEKKGMTRQILFLATEFESTRIQDNRMEKLFKEDPKPIIPRTTDRFNDIALVTDKRFQVEWTDAGAEDENEETMVLSVFKIFRTFDRDDLHLISMEEFKEMLESFGLMISDDHYKQLVKFYEMNTQGLFKFQECNEILIEILMGHVFFHNAEIELDLRAKHYFNMSLLTQYSDEVYETIDEIIADCLEKDVERYDFVTPEIFENLLWSYEDRFFEGELKEILPVLYAKFKKQEDEFFYLDIKDDIINYKAVNIAKGLVDNDRDSLEQFFIELFKKYDPELVGKISKETLLKALTESLDFKFILVQNLIISNLVPVDKDGMFDYQENSYNVSNYLKYLFNKKNIDRKVRYKPRVLQNKTKVDVFAFSNMKAEVLTILKYYDKNQDNHLDATEFASIFDDLTNTYVKEVQMSDSFALMDEDFDGLLSEDELCKNPFEVVKYITREKALIDLKKKFIII